MDARTSWQAAPRCTILWGTLSELNPRFSLRRENARVRTNEMVGQERGAPWPPHSPAAKMEFPLAVAGAAETGDEGEGGRDPRAEATLQVRQLCPPTRLLPSTCLIASLKFHTCFCPPLLQTILACRQYAQVYSSTLQGSAGPCTAPISQLGAAFGAVDLSQVLSLRNAHRMFRWARKGFGNGTR